jgi:HEAT repeat protein
MAARESLDDKLESLRALRGRLITSEQSPELRKRIGDKSNLVVAAAAAIAGENTLIELAKDLEAAFDRFMVNPLKDDKLCRAKIAIVQALDKMEHLPTGVFRKGASHFQLEPVWGGTEDSAPPLRAAAIVALARVEGPGALPLLVDVLTDPAKEVRAAAAIALGAVGTETAGLVLRLKAHVGDSDPDVLSECLLALLAIDPKEYLPIVAEFLDPIDADTCEAAALALGKSRLPEALEPLKECLRKSVSRELNQQLLLAIAILRRPAAIDYLVEIVATEPEPMAAAALTALRIYKQDPRLRERVGAAVRERGSSALTAGFEREFRQG